MLRSTGVKGKNVDRVRVIRVLEYEGPRDWVETCLGARTVKGTKDCGNGCVIREGMIGDFPVVVEEEVKESFIRESKKAVFMERFGWEINTVPIVKRDHITGKVVAHKGDETWDRDLKVAGE